MKKLLLILMLLGLGLIVYVGIVPKYKFKYYYYSKDSTRILTRISYPNNFFLLNDTYFVPGFYNKQELPGTYVKPDRSSHGEWDEYVTFHSKGIYIIGAPAKTKNLTDDFRYFTSSITFYSEARKTDSLESSFINPEKISLYSFDK